MGDSLEDLTSGLIGGKGINIRGKVSIGGRQYTQAADGTFTETTPDAESAQPTTKAPKAAKQDSDNTPIIIGDVAGRDVTKVTISAEGDGAASLLRKLLGL